MNNARRRRTFHLQKRKDMSRPRKATLIEAAEYLEVKASRERDLANDFRWLGTEERASSSDRLAKTYDRWAKHIKAAAEQA